MKKIIADVFIISIALIISLQLWGAGSVVNHSSNYLILPQETDRLIIQGKKLKTDGDFLAAVEVFKQAFVLAENGNEPKIEIDCLLELGTLYWNLGQMDRAIECYEQASTRLEKNAINELKDEVLFSIQIYHLYQSGKKSRDNGEYQESIDSFSQAIDLADQISSYEHKVKCLRQLSVTYSEIKNSLKFLDLNKEALELARKLNHRIEEGRCLYNIGLYYDSIENYSRALLHYEDALKIARENQSLNDESYCLTNISHIYIQVGNYDKALDYLNEVLKIDREIEEDDYVAIDLNNIGVTYQKKAKQSETKEDLNTALSYFKESMELASLIEDDKTEIQALTNIGMVYIDQENYAEAIVYFETALDRAEKIGDKEEIANLRVNLGMVNNRLGNEHEAVDHIRRAVEIASSPKEAAILWEAYLELANAYRQQKKYTESIDSYKESIKYIEEIRSKIQLEELKAIYLGVDRRIDTYQNLIDLLVKLNDENPNFGYKEDAFFYLERAKARAFLDRLEISQVNFSQNVDWKLLKQEEAVLSELSSLNAALYKTGISEDERLETEKKIETAEADLEALKRKIRSSGSGYVNLRYPKIISLHEVQKKLLDNHTAFFEYCLTEKNSYVFVITKKKLEIISLPHQEKISSMVRKHLNNITDKANQNFHSGYSLFLTLVFPGLNENIKNLIIIPDDILHYLPFETLLTDVEQNTWLIKNYNIAYAPSISSLREIIQRKRSFVKKPKKQLLAVGDPIFDLEKKKTEKGPVSESYEAADTPNLPRLKYSGLEIEKIADLFSRTDTLKRGQASEGVFKAMNLADYKILHFATHCLIDDKKPARSSIVFSLYNSSEEDGFLQMREIFYLKLNSDLVTLSSCQTGGGQLIKGEGIEGLSRAFFYAGTSAALISLWSINDQATSQFMERFYFYLRSNQSIMTSLQKTKLEMIESGTLSHPYYWAGFVVTGAAKKVVFRSYKKTIVSSVIILLSIGIGFVLIRRLFF